MSVENAKAFIEMAQSDVGLRALLRASKTEDKEESIAAVVKIAAGHACTFTADQYKEAAKAHMEEGELSEEDLKKVVGGRQWDGGVG